MAYTKTQVDDMMDRNLNPFRQDVVGDDSIIILATSPTKLLVNGNTRNAAKAPSYMTDRWNTTTSIMKAISEYDGPTYVGDIGLVYTPTVPNSEGNLTVRVYINDASPKLIRTYTSRYKGSVIPMNVLTTWYWGEETGYDAKNDGVYFTLEFEHAGTVTAPSIIIYNTQ